MRGSLIETMDEDYIRTARAKGLPERAVVPPGRALVDQPDRRRCSGWTSGSLLGGAVLVETVFNIPGVGPPRLRRDHPRRLPDRSQGTVLLAALFIIVANILVDIAYAYLDPRVRYS